MFLSERSRQVEYLDLAGLSPEQISTAYSELKRVNRLFKFSHVFTHTLTRLLDRQRCAHLEILDIGAGDGSLGQVLTEWARTQKWNWHFTNLDSSSQALALSKTGKNVIGSALDLPFNDGAFDVVIASQMTHHLGEDKNVVRHFREAWRVTRDAIVITDVHRNVGLYGLVWIGTLLAGCSRELRSDGLTSVKRGFRCGEWREFSRQADISDAEVWLYLGTRIVLQARKGRA